MTLPGTYARSDIQLGYAATALRAQGRTVDSAHLVVSEATTREVLYVGMTRGRDANHVYVPAGAAADDAQRPMERGWRDVLEGVLRTRGSDVSSSLMLEEEHERSTSIRQLVAEYETLAAHVARERFGPVLESVVGAELHRRLRQSDAYDALIAVMRAADARGGAVRELVERAAGERSLKIARYEAAVQHRRLADRLAIAVGDAPGSGPDCVLGLFERITSEDPSTQRALSEREEAIRRRAEFVLDDALASRASWTSRLSPACAASGAVREQALTIAAYWEAFDVSEEQPTPSRLRAGMAAVSPSIGARH